MTLHRLARELDETARQTTVLVEAITDALAVLKSGESGAEYAAAMIVSALQRQDRLEQRCRSLAFVARQFAALPEKAPESAYDEIWASLPLDELRLPALSGIAAMQSDGDIELF